MNPLHAAAMINSPHFRNGAQLNPEHNIWIPIAIKVCDGDLARSLRGQRQRP